MLCDPSLYHLSTYPVLQGINQLCAVYTLVTIVSNNSIYNVAVRYLSNSPLTLTNDGQMIEASEPADTVHTSIN